MMRHMGATIAFSLVCLLHAAPASAAGKTLSEFLASCNSDSTWCRNEIVAEAHDFDDFIGICTPNTVSEDALAATVLPWLRRHTEKSSQDAYDVIDDAIDDIWPCTN